MGLQRSMLLVSETDNEPRVRDGYTSLSTRGHARATRTQAEVRICRENLTKCPLRLGPAAKPAHLQPRRTATRDAIPVGPQRLPIRAPRLQLEHLTLLDHRGTSSIDNGSRNHTRAATMTTPLKPEGVRLHSPRRRRPASEQKQDRENAAARGRGSQEESCAVTPESSLVRSPRSRRGFRDPYATSRIRRKSATCAIAARGAGVSGEGVEKHEVVDRAAVADLRHRHTSLRELPGVRFALVAKYVVLRVDHERWRLKYLQMWIFRCLPWRDFDSSRVRDGVAGGGLRKLPRCAAVRVATLIATEPNSTAALEPQATAAEPALTG